LMPYQLYFNEYYTEYSKNRKAIFSIDNFWRIFP